MAAVLGGAVLEGVVGGGGAPAVVGEPTEAVPVTSVVAVVAAALARVPDSEVARPGAGVEVGQEQKRSRCDRQSDDNAT